MPTRAADENRVCVARSPLEQEMLLVCQMLEAEGFHPAVRGRPLFGVGVVSFGGGDAFEVTVPPEEAEAIMELLARIDREYRPEVPDSIAPEESASPCPQCGSPHGIVTRDPGGRGVSGLP